MLEQAVYKLLTLNKNAATSVYNMLKKLKGLKCIIRKPAMHTQPVDQYQPGSNRTIFGLEDLTDYEEWESYEDTLLLFNIFQEGYVANDEFDTFTSNAYCLTTMQEKLPQQTLIEVNFYGRRMYYKVDEHRNLTASVTEQLFVKNILVPAT
jgi:hypothetical protein